MCYPLIIWCICFRSLVALSLILAMLLFKPAPIYILDEVDAALDLSHTQNIGQMLRTHFTHSQVIHKMSYTLVFQHISNIQLSHDYLNKLNEPFFFLCSLWWCLWKMECSPMRTCSSKPNLWTASPRSLAQLKLTKERFWPSAPRRKLGTNASDRSWPAKHFVCCTNV